MWFSALLIIKKMFLVLSAQIAPHPLVRICWKCEVVGPRLFQFTKKNPSFFVFINFYYMVM
jgi:hypothetical protein